MKNTGMIPTLAVPNVQVPPPIDTSVFTAPGPDPAIGRLPLNVVPATVTNPKVADDNRNSQPMPRGGTANVPSARASGTPFYLAAQGELAFESPYSTPFIAQLFGQFAGFEGGDAIGGLLDFEQLARMNLVKYKPSLAFRPRESAPEPVVQQQAETAPVRTAPQQAEVGPLQAMMRSAFGSAATSVDLREVPMASTDVPFAFDRPVVQEPAVPAGAVKVPPSIFISGPDAYGATQSRNQLELTDVVSTRAGDKEVQLVL